MPLAALAAVGIAGSIGGAAISSHAAGKAAGVQADAANRAAELDYQKSREALDYQKQKDQQSRQDFAPWLDAGKQGIGELQYMMGLGSQNPSGVNTGLGGYGSLLQSNPYSTFTAPTGLTEQNDPGFQARLKMGTDAMQKSAAARGSLLTGGTAKALDQYGQDYASNEYGNVYGRALNTFQTNHNAFNENQTNQYNKLAALSGVGQQTASQLGQLGQQSSNNVTSNLLSTANNMGQQYNNAAAANASGYVGSANAWSGALNNGTNSLMNLYMLQQMGGGSGLGYGLGGA